MATPNRRWLITAASAVAITLQACSTDADSPLSPSAASLVDSPPPAWSVTKTAETSGGPSFDWDLEKSISPASLVLEQGESGTFNYTVTATRSDGGAGTGVFNVSGEICVTNNSGAPTQNLRIEDRLWLNALVALVDVDVDTSENPVLDNGESHCYPYSYDMPEGFVPDPNAAYVNKAYVFNTQTVSGVLKEVRVAETTVSVVWPSVADATATVVDLLICPEGFTCSPTTGEWLFTGTGTVNYGVLVTNVSAPCGSEVYVRNTAVLTESDSGDTDEDSASGLVSTQECAPPPSIEGCTPGYWKQTQHFDSWVGYTQGQDFDTVFGVNLFSPNRTLLQALSAGGGGADRLGRHATAALLNTSNGGVDYGMSSAQVIEAVQQAVASGNFDIVSDRFETLNERGCPLN